MTLAEQLVEHLRPRDGFGALPGPKFALSALIPAGKTIDVRTGVSVQFPHAPLEWRTKNRNDGGVELLFTSADVPRIVAATPVVSLTADITGLLLWIGAEAMQVELQLRGWPDFRLSLTL